MHGNPDEARSARIVLKDYVNVSVYDFMSFRENCCSAIPHPIAQMNQPICK